MLYFVLLIMLYNNVGKLMKLRELRREVYVQINSIGYGWHIIK